MKIGRINTLVFLFCSFSHFSLLCSVAPLLSPFLSLLSRISSLFEIQRFWARNLDPSSDSKKFEDPTGVVIPILEQKDICTRCGVEFAAEDNDMQSCTYHGDDEGNPGEYKERVIIDEITGKEQR
jgi:hypothetical protein